MEGARILLVDDEVEFLSALAERLELRGFEVRTANDGETAMQILSDYRPHVMVLDIKMPGVSGIDVLNRVRVQARKPAVILLTGFGSKSEGIEGMRLGAFDFLMKPIDINSLIEKIHEAADSIAETDRHR